MPILIYLCVPHRAHLLVFSQYVQTNPLCRQQEVLFPQLSVLLTTVCARGRVEIQPKANEGQFQPRLLQVCSILESIFEVQCVR